MNCPACGHEVAGAARFCPACGRSLDPAAASPTRTIHAGSGSSSAPSSDSLDHGRFIPGTLLLDRYRILGLLGRGGMGEVYRADDLKLAQQVALKFLPPDPARDAGRLARFHNEVRLARQVSHPNVCRVYDLGEVDGQTFLSMEYIDGEDLATLLRRIGRLPRDKAVEIARQLCAGLAAAHDRGVLHRDLKPANVMVDGRGRARITDFGLAGVAGTAEAAGTRAGTPAYMAPEQLAGGEATVKSDLFALGLVLYELFTGKRAFHGETFAELARSRAESSPTPPSSLVEGFDPAVERVILRCLESDPRQRPPSALALAAALPGGDPLAMALAAGETPSPEMVAAAGETGGLRPLAVWLCLGVVIAGVLGIARLGESALLVRRVPLPKSAEVLADRAREVISRFGYTEPPAGAASGFGWHRTYLEYVQEHDASPGRWDRLAKPRPSGIYFWYRQSPRPLLAASASALVVLEDPAPVLPGMASVYLAANGDLWHFDAVPPQLDDGGEAAPVDWTPLFSLAGLTFADFKPVTPRWVPPVYGDTRGAWEGAYADAPDFPVRVEAAAYRGRPVYFYVYWPWNRPLRAQPFLPTAAEKMGNRMILTLILSAIFAGVLLARRNLRANRVDRKGASRLALFVFSASLGAALCRASHSSDPWEEWLILVRLLGGASFDGGLAWVYYAALEPAVRRLSPDRIIAWTRLLSGRLRDPLVGRDILIGVTLGVGPVLIERLLQVLPMWLGQPPAMPDHGDINLLPGPRWWVGAILDHLKERIHIAMMLVFLLLLMRVLLRRPWAAAIGFFGVASTVIVLRLDAGAPGVAAGLALGGLFTLALMRFGLLTMTTTLFVSTVLLEFPISLDLTSWYGLSALFALAVIATLTVLAALAALAGRSLFELRLLEE